MNVGDKVRVKDPDDYISDKARKLRNRVGLVTHLQRYSGRPIVRFYKEGRRQEYVCDFPESALEVVK